MVDTRCRRRRDSPSLVDCKGHAHLQASKEGSNLTPTVFVFFALLLTTQHTEMPTMMPMTRAPDTATAMMALVVMGPV
jgi:hypothetical protein